MLQIGISRETRYSVFSATTEYRVSRDKSKHSLCILYAREVPTLVSYVCARDQGCWPQAGSAIADFPELCARTEQTPGNRLSPSRLGTSSPDLSHRHS